MFASTRVQCFAVNILKTKRNSIGSMRHNWQRRGRAARARARTHQKVSLSNGQKIKAVRRWWFVTMSLCCCCWQILCSQIRQYIRIRCLFCFCFKGREDIDKVFSTYHVFTHLLKAQCRDLIELGVDARIDVRFITNWSVWFYLLRRNIWI